MQYCLSRTDPISETKLSHVQQSRSPTICMSKSSDEFVMQIFGCFSVWLEVLYNLSLGK